MSVFGSFRNWLFHYSKAFTNKSSSAAYRAISPWRYSFMRTATSFAWSSIRSRKIWTTWTRSTTVSHCMLSQTLVVARWPNRWRPMWIVCSFHRECSSWFDWDVDSYIRIESFENVTSSHWCLVLFLIGSYADHCVLLCKLLCVQSFNQQLQEFREEESGSHSAAFVSQARWRDTGPRLGSQDCQPNGRIWFGMLNI